MIDFQSYSDASRLQTEAILAARFERVERAVRELPGSSAERQRIEDGWTADCPLCPWNKPTRFFITREGVLVACPAGHDSVQINEETDSLREVVETEAKAVETANAYSVGVADFFATCDEKIQWLCEPFIAKGTFTLIQGAPKSGKTFFASWLTATLVASGKKVVFVEEEGAKEMLRDRLAPFLQPDPRVFNDLLRIIFRKNVKLDVDTSVRALIEACAGADVLVLDPFASLHAADENDAAELTLVLQAIQRLITAIPGLSVILLHHTKKGATWDKSDSGAASSADARGSGATVGAADQIINVKAVAAGARVAGQVRCYVENTDTRIGAPFEKKLAAIKLDGGVGTLEWIEESSDEEQQDDLIERLRLILKPAPDYTGQKELRAALRVKLDRLRAAIFTGMERKIFVQTRHGVSLA